MSKLNKRIKEKFENFFDWIKGAELVELETCNTKEDPIRPELDAVSYTHLTLPTICSV